VLLKVGAHFKYAALQHVRGSTRTSADDADISLEWLDDTSFEGEPPTANQLADFRPKSVSAVAKAAAQYASQLSGSGGNAHSGARGSTRGGSRGGSRGGARCRARGPVSAVKGKRKRVESSEEEEREEEEGEEEEEEEVEEEEDVE
jgi:hypothetical protein